MPRRLLPVLQLVVLVAFALPAAAGTITNFAGTAGYAGDGGPATTALLLSVEGIAADAAVPGEAAKSLAACTCAGNAVGVGRAFREWLFALLRS